jgi:Family of unknown function (DUF6153)
MAIVVGVTRDALGQPARWLLLGALVLGVVLMHHVPAAGPPGMPDTHAMPSAVLHLDTADHMQPASDVQAPDPMHPHHVLAHLCLAVLGGMALLVLALAGTVVGRAPVAAPRPPLAAPRVDRPPGGAGRRLLASLCVLRL